MIEKFFKIKERGSTITTEVIGGITTFTTLSYIIFVQPAVLSTTGMDFGAVLVATVLSSAIATLLMAFLANYPFALAPGMGSNFFFAFTVCGTISIGGLGYSWQVALGANFIAGIIFLILSFFNFREKIIEIVPESLKQAIATGIGLLITFVGLQWSGLIVDSPGTLVKLGNLKQIPVLISIFGIFLTSILIILKIRSSLLTGIFFTSLVAYFAGIIEYEGIISLPPSLEPTLGKLSFADFSFNPEFISIIFLFFFLDLFDTVGTLIGLGSQAGFIRQGKLPSASKAFISDALGTTIGSILGTSTVTTYIESSTGINAGARTGFASLITAILILLALFFYPFIKMVGGGYALPDGKMIYPIIAPSLVITGMYMMKNITYIDWNDFSESIPAFITLIMIPLSFSISEGIAAGFISYVFINAMANLFKKEKKKISLWLYFLSLFLMIKFFFF